MDKPEAKQYQAVVGGKTVIIETGKLAGQAGGAVTVRLGDLIVFAAATMGGVREGTDFFPLTIDYEERMYAGGRIPGSFFRREGKPSEDAILISRLTDRPLRPLFPEHMRNEVQVIMFSLSADMENSLDMLAVNAASAAMMISDIPWGGPIGAVRIGRVNGEFIANPTFAEREVSDLDLRIAGSRDAILMVESGSDIISEADMVKALLFGHESLQPLIDAQEKMAAEIGKAKREVVLGEVNTSLIDQIRVKAAGELKALFEAPYHKAEMYGGIDKLRESIAAELIAEDEDSQTSNFGSLRNRTQRGRPRSHPGKRHSPGWS